ncbi:sensor histidine kinase [Paenibacillus cymbidii]|uniref:sensor histidine kinase n=1 Tax=Paenibacillus cymbidii TaxID=1639034 RepID=UPI001081CF4E|nr:sensor histidine kinase [Paenibacillus cymbidii]
MNRKYSVRYKIVAGFVLVLVPLVFFLFYNNYYAMNIVREKISGNYSNLLAQYARTTDDTLREFESYLYRMKTDSDVIMLNSYLPGSDDYVIARQRILNRFTTDIGNYSIIDTFFFYSRTIDDLPIMTRNSTVYYDRVNTIRRFLLEQIEADGERRGWSLLRTEKENLLIRFEYTASGMYAGAVIDLRKLVEPLGSWNVGEGGGAVIAGEDGAPVATAAFAADRYKAMAADIRPPVRSYETVEERATGRSYLVVRQAAQNAPIAFVLLIAERNVLQNLPYLQKTIYLIPLAVIVVVMLYFAFLQRVFFKPMTLLIKGMRRISQGNFDVRLQEERSLEFAFLVSTFNDMAGQIEKLKISVYEEQLHAQQAELKQLQVQINPHFYMNSLNIIYNLAALKEYRTVQKMSLHLADYFRYIMQAGRPLITLGDELRHIRNYLDIQTLRYPDTLTYAIDVPERYSGLRLPPLILQPFVENAVIHGFRKSRVVFHIAIEAGIETEQEPPSGSLLVRISDNGVGFSPAQLEQLNDAAYESQAGAGDTHLGIWNVMRRLRMQFGADAGVSFAGGSDGAVVVIRLPMEAEEQKEETSHVQSAGS